MPGFKPINPSHLNHCSVHKIPYSLAIMQLSNQSLLFTDYFVWCTHFIANILLIINTFLCFIKAICYSRTCYTVIFLGFLGYNPKWKLSENFRYFYEMLFATHFSECFHRFYVEQQQQNIPRIIRAKWHQTDSLNKYNECVHRRCVSRKRCYHGNLKSALALFL